MNDWIVETVEQPFFKRARILRRSPPPTAGPAELSKQPLHAGQLNGRTQLLTGRLDTFNHLAAADPPVGLEQMEAATVYLHMADWWTTECEFGELVLEEFEDIPFSRDMGEVEIALMEDLREMLADHIEAPALQLGAAGWLMTKWVVAAGALLRRELHLSPGGKVVREDTVYDAELSVPLGRFWGLDDRGRVVPVG